MRLPEKKTSYRPPRQRFSKRWSIKKGVELNNDKLDIEPLLGDFDARSLAQKR